MSKKFKIENPVSILSIVPQEVKAELLVLVARKNTSMKQEILEAIQAHLSLEENQKYLKGSQDVHSTSSNV